MWTSAVGIGMGAWALGIGAAVVAQRRLIFRPPVHLRTLVAGPHADTYRIKPMSLPVGDGAVLEGWRSIRRQGKSRSGTLLYFGGRGENVGWAPHMSSYFLGWSVVAFNYRGFGRSTGQATEARTVLDSRRIFDACSQPEEGQAPMVLMGRSLGTAVAIRLASVVAPDRLVLLSPFVSLVALAKSNPLLAPAAMLVRHRFDSTPYAPKVDCRTLVVMAANDRRVPNRHSLDLARRLGGPVSISTLAGQEHRSLPRCVAAQNLIADFLGQP